MDRGQLETRFAGSGVRSEEHTSELQSRFDLVCRLLLEKKKIFVGEPPRLPQFMGVLVKLRANAFSVSGTTSTGVAAAKSATRSSGHESRAFFFLMRRYPPRSTLFPYTTLFR